MTAARPTREEFTITVPHQGVREVSAILDQPGVEPRGVLVLAHGSGAPMGSDFLEAVAPRIAEAAQLAVLRFNYAYAELMVRSGGRRPPERRPALESVHQAAVEVARARFPGLPLLGGGKSLGGRIATLMAADGVPFDGLVLLGYPLHPPGKPERQRVEHFPSVGVPTLFLQGTRDALADLDLLRPALERFQGPATLHVVEGGDHSFAVLRRSGRTPEDVLEELAAATASWTSEVLGG